METRNKTSIFLRRNGAFYPGNECGFYLVVSKLQNSNRLLVIDKMYAYIPFAYDWYYDDEQQSVTHCHSNLSLTVNTVRLTLRLEERGNCKKNQAFIYNQSSNELFWKNPITKRLHVIYIRCCQIFETSITRRHCSVAMNSMDMIKSFDQISTINQKQRLWRRSTAYSLSKYNGTCDMSSQTIQSWFGSIESFAHNNVTFGLFKVKEGGYLIGDGYGITIAHPEKFEGSDHKYYGLWKVGQGNGHLIHYLSGNYVPLLKTFKFFVSR